MNGHLLKDSSQNLFRENDFGVRVPPVADLVAEPVVGYISKELFVTDAVGERPGMRSPREIEDVDIA